MVLAGGHQRAAACGLVGVTYRRRRNFGAEGEKLHGDSMAGARGPRHGASPEQVRGAGPRLGYGSCERAYGRRPALPPVWEGIETGVQKV